MEPMLKGAAPQAAPGLRTGITPGIAAGIAAGIGIFIAFIGLKEAGLDRLIRAGYALLDLVTYFTVGPKEARAWTITQGTKAPQAAGVIHSDFERGFIRSETIGYNDFIVNSGEGGTITRPLTPSRST